MALMPRGKRITSTANRNCSPSPHSTVFSRIARRLVEKTYASESKTRIPRTPENRYIALLSSANAPQKCEVDRAGNCKRRYCRQRREFFFKSPGNRQLLQR